MTFGITRPLTGYPVLLDDSLAPKLRTYPKYTVIAEKFHAVCLLGMINTQMKDYFDLWVLLYDSTLAQARQEMGVSGHAATHHRGNASHRHAGAAQLLKSFGKFAIDAAARSIRPRAAISQSL